MTRHQEVRFLAIERDVELFNAALYRHKASVVIQIDGPIFTFRDGRNQATSSLVCGNAATFRAETYASFGAAAPPVSQRERVLVNGCLLAFQ